MKTIAGFSGEVWLTVTEISNLNGLNVATIREACAEREGSYRGGRYIFRKIGKRYEILLTSLPEYTQAEYWIKHHKPTQSTVPVIVKSQVPESLTHEAYQVIWDRYSRKADSIQTEARRRVEILDEYFKLINCGLKRSFVLDTLKLRYPGISKPTLWRWQKCTLEHPRHYWEALLAPGYEGRSKTEILEPAWEFFLRNWLSENQPDTSVIYAETLKEAKVRGWGTLPSYKTFLRRTKDLPENLRILGREGVTVLKQKLPHLWRDYTALKFHQLWESDGRKADVFCRWPDGTVGRPFVVVWREVRTRVVLSVRIYPFANGEIVMESFESALRRANTIPTDTVIDNGREFANKPFTGGQKNRYRFVVKENEPMGALTRLGVKVYWTTPYHGAAKPIESFWGKLAKTVDCLFPKAYTGRNTVERPENCDPKHAIPIEQFAARLIKGIHEFHNTPHSGQGMCGKTPLELYEELSKEYTPQQPTTLQLSAMRPYVFRVKLRSQYFFEFQLKGFGKARYEPPEKLDLRRGYEYDVLPDNADPTAPALIFNGESYLGEAIYKGHTAFLDPDAGREILKTRANTLKQNHKLLKVIKGELTALPVLPGGQTALPSLPQIENIIKLPQETPLKPEDIIQIQDDGSALNTQTGELIKPVERPIISESNNNNEMEEAERKRKEKADKSFEAWKAKTSDKNHSGGNLNDSDTTPNGTYKEL